jgi:hypothetical protein
VGPTKAPYHDAASRPAHHPVDDQATSAHGAPIAGRIGVRQGLAVLVAAQALALWLLGRASFFRSDDWIYFSEMHKQGRFSEDWLTSIWWKHIAPLHRGMFTLLDHATPAAYTWALLFEIAMVALAAVAFYGVLELLFGRSWWLLIPVALLGFSFNFALPLVWPSSGFQAMPETAFSIVCLYAYLRHLKSGRIAWAVVAAVALGIGLCFYIRPLLMLPLLLVLRFLFLESSLRPSAILRALWREKLTWAILLVPAAVFLYMYIHRDAFGQRPPLNLTDLQHYVREAWFRNVFPAALGVRELPGTLDAPHLAAEVAGQLGLLGLVALSFWRKGIEALRGWAFMLIAIALTFGLTATGKLAESGVAIGLETRYVTNLTWLVPLGALMALHPRAVAQLGAPWPTDTEVAPRRPLPVWAPRAGILAAVTLTLVSCGLALGGSHRIIKEWGAQPGRPWVKNALASLKGFEARGDVPRLPDGPVPPGVVDPAFAAYNWRHTVLPELGEPVATAPPYNALQQPDGTIVPARVKPELRLSLTAPDASAQVTGLKRDGVCLGATDAAEGLIVWTLPRAVQGPMVIASLSAPGRVPKQGVPIDVDSGFGLPVTTLHTIQPVGEPMIDTGETKVVRLRLHVAPGQRICASSLAVGVLVPTA